MTQLNSFGLGLFATLALLRPIDAAPQSEGSSGGGAQSVTDEPSSGLMTTSTVRNVQSIETECLDRAPVYRITAFGRDWSLFGGGCRTTATTVSCGQQSRNPPQT